MVHQHLELLGLRLVCRILQQQASKVCHDALLSDMHGCPVPVQKTQPMAVGGIGMISTANYVARKYGVRSAMPGFIARELCPQLVFAKPNFSKYSAASRASRVIFADYDAEFSAGSLDEAHLDVTDYCSQQGLTGTLPQPYLSGPKPR